MQWQQHSVCEEKYFILADLCTVWNDLESEPTPVKPHHV